MVNHMIIYRGQIVEKNSNDYVMECFSEEFEGIDFDM